jgi:hypothetical protein
VHSNLIEEIAWQLAPKVSPKYVALTNQRVVVTVPDPLEMPSSGVRIPDVAVFAASGSTVTESTTMAAPLVLDAILPEAIPHSFVEICDVANRNLVAAIEVLPLTNKRGDGLEEYRQKRQEYLSSKCHFVEIDLLRSGERYPVAGVLPSVPTRSAGGVADHLCPLPVRSDAASRSATPAAVVA